MNLETVFNFIKERRGYKVPLRYKLFNRIPLSEEELNVEGDLDLSNTNIKSLPDNLTVRGSLFVNSTKITSLPDNLTVRGSLFVNSTNITSLPDNLKVGDTLNLNFTNITSLPDNLTVRGSLFLWSTPLSKKYTQEQIRNMIEEKGGYVGDMIST